MNYIGEKIKELRRKNDMTQEKLADLLSVSYQTVSKWECGVSNPDVYTIAPLARIFGVSTDDLLGVTDGDARRAEFDRLLDEYYKKDSGEMMKIAEEAVREFPEDMRYLEILAYTESTAAIYRSEDEERSTDETALLEKSVAHLETVIRNTPRHEIKRQTVILIVCALRKLGRIDDAKKYAELAPDDRHTAWNDVLKFCLEGDELYNLQKKIIFDTLHSMTTNLTYMYGRSPTDKGFIIPALEAEEAVIKAIITDGNYRGFNYPLFENYAIRCELAMERGEYDIAITYLKGVKNSIDGMVSYLSGEKPNYTCPLLDGCSEDIYSDTPDMSGSWKYFIGREIFDPIRDREDFKALAE